MNEKNMKQFASYLVVGGIATIVEWVGFWILNQLLGIQYLVSTTIAFCISTQVNLVLGRKMTFKEACQNGGSLKEVASIYAASIIGLLLNLALMYVMVSKVYIPAAISKVIATGIVFFWNFLIRKLAIYRVPVNK